VRNRGILGRSWGLLGRFRAVSGALFGSLGSLLGGLGASWWIWWGLGPLLGRSWVALGSLWGALGPLLAGLRGLLSPLGSLLAGHWLCRQAQDAFYEKVLLARAGARKWWSRGVLGSSWVAVWWSWVALGGSWVALGSLLGAVGSTTRFSSRFWVVLGGQGQTFVGGGDSACFAPPTRAVNSKNRRDQEDQEDQEDQQGSRTSKDRIKTAPHASWPRRGRRITK